MARAATDPEVSHQGATQNTTAQPKTTLSMHACTIRTWRGTDKHDPSPISLPNVPPRIPATMTAGTAPTNSGRILAVRSHVFLSMYSESNTCRKSRSLQFLQRGRAGCSRQVRVQRFGSESGRSQSTRERIWQMQDWWRDWAPRANLFPRRNLILKLVKFLLPTLRWIKQADQPLAYTNGFVKPVLFGDEQSSSRRRVLSQPSSASADQTNFGQRVDSGMESQPYLDQ